MPQISQTELFLSQIFWLFLSFAIVYYFIAKFAGPRLNNIISGRNNIIAGDIEVAENAKEKAEKSQVEFEESLVKARQTSSSIISEANGKAKTNYETQIKISENSLKNEISKAEQEISVAKELALESLNKASSEFVEQILIKLTGFSTNKEIIEKTLNNNG
jgi:F-type H+-transporting ATPase subunit b